MFTRLRRESMPADLRSYLTFGHAQFGAARARVGGNLLVGRAHWSARLDIQPIVVSKRFLYEPILERVKTDYCQPPTCPQAIGYSTQGHFEPLQFVVHRDTQRLKRARRRIDPLVARSRD